MMPVREVAKDRWRGILAHFGLTDKQLSGKHCPCPVCGGKDRFRFDDKDGRGTYFCTHCGAGDGVALVMSLTGKGFREAAEEIEGIAGVLKPHQAAKPEDEDKKVARLRQVWGEALPLSPGDDGMRYLAGRGLSIPSPPHSLRLHPGLAYHDGERFIGRYQVLLALVTWADGTAATLHRTYLLDGHKAPVEEPKKLMPGKPITGGAIRLSPAGECLGIAEGIETAMAASELFSVPVWSCINANGVETFAPPPGTNRLIIFADNDESFTGQKAAYAAAFRLRQVNLAVEVKVPPIVGDWLDVLNGGNA